MASSFPPSAPKQHKTSKEKKKKQQQQQQRPLLRRKISKISFPHLQQKPNQTLLNKTAQL
jgi:hypothetical protein